MITLRLVRHGEASAGFGDDLDPGLSAVGVQQAAAAAAVLAAGPRAAVVTSPLRRARETAAPLASRWAVEPDVEPAVGEITTPTDDLAERSAWLRGFLSGTWAEQADGTHRWRDALVARLLAAEEDTIFFSHFVAINAVVAAATGDERTVVFRPSYCSVTTVATDGRGLTVMALGGEASTVVRPG